MGWFADWFQRRRKLRNPAAAALGLLEKVLVEAANDRETIAEVVRVSNFVHNLVHAERLPELPEHADQLAQSYGLLFVGKGLDLRGYEAPVTNGDCLDWNFGAVGNLAHHVYHLGTPGVVLLRRMGLDDFDYSLGCYRLLQPVAADSGELRFSRDDIDDGDPVL